MFGWKLNPMLAAIEMSLSGFCVVSHEQGTAVVTLNAEIWDEVLKNVLEEQDSKLLSIQKRGKVCV